MQVIFTNISFQVFIAAAVVQMALLGFVLQVHTYIYSIYIQDTITIHNARYITKYEEQIFTSYLPKVFNTQQNES